MNPEEFGRNFEWAGQTNAHPLGVVILICLAGFILIGKKDFVVVALLMLMALIPSAQRLVIFSVDFSFIRLLILAAIFRKYFRGERSSLEMSAPDRAIIIWGIFSIFAYGILFKSFGAVVTRAGYMVDVIGAYFVGRIYVNGWRDMRRIVLFFVYISLPVLLVFLIERTIGRNYFSAFGGVPELTLVRDGRLRCQGPFSHPIMAGLFWASAFPLIAAAWLNWKIGKPLLIMAMFFALAIVFNTASSTPVMALLISICGLLMYRQRDFLKALRWAALLVLIGLHFIMEKPVWHLISRIDLSGGSTSWHRYHLIDKAILNFNEWWLVGTPSTAHWGYGLEDVTNQFILEGVRSGFFCMLLFIIFFLSVFKSIGSGISATASNRMRYLLWAGGVLVFTNVISFLSVAYFGQMVSFFYLIIGAMVSISRNVIQRKRVDDDSLGGFRFA